ncbi:Ig-like and fibronectin type-III domain-containing protein 1 [Babylonia areolata]|uniref:Ig-like and fibronectin type-III domain-containing protein 1 n=1 Tax=Babylonia areolata TaxID=304850 RepID=UPI003FD53C81
MDWKVIVLTLILTVSRQVHGQPEVRTSDGQVISGTLGGVVAMTCEVRNLGSSVVKWVFVKHSLPLFRGLQKLVKDPQYSLQHPDSSIYTLLISNLTAMNQGVYRCEVEGTSEAATFQLNITDSPVPPVMDYTPDQTLNRTGCCQLRGVREACLPLCAPASSSEVSVDLAVCRDELDNFVYCASDGRSHENCCAWQGVPSECLGLCNNDPLTIPTVSPTCHASFLTIVSCYQYGGALIPSHPESLSVLPYTKNNESHLVVSWKKPMYNPSAVVGYYVFYKRSTDAAFQATALLNAGTLQYRMLAEAGALYILYTVAVGHHGSSQPSESVEIAAEDPLAGIEPVPVSICCGARKVPVECEVKLCQPQLWTSFDVNAMLDCYTHLPDVFACLAGESDHTSCCRNNHVPDPCLPACSGSPPAFNASLAMCIPQLPVIEACVQQGQKTQPKAPDGLSLTTVTADSAVVVWADPTSYGREPVDVYHVQLQRGNISAAWSSVTEVVGTLVKLSNLTESENYAVRVIAEVRNVSSLPSNSVRFRTLPATTPPFKPTVVHNLTECCENSGMPQVCVYGCQYGTGMTAYFRQHLMTCGMHIGTVLTCAADGRDHTPCCMEQNVKEICYGMCVLNAPGRLDERYLACLNDTAKIVSCFEEGLEDLVRMPEEVTVTSITAFTITVQWSNPETGPTPDTYEVYLASDSFTRKTTTTGQVIVLQDLEPKTEYSLTLKSRLNGTSSPPTQAITVHTTDTGVKSPFIPSVPTNASRALWNSREHCCRSSGIKEECQPLCLNQPSTAANCTMENQKILACAADGHDHSACCREEGLVEDCVPLCSGRTFSNFSVRQAGCLAEDSLTIITSCFLSNTGLLPAAPKGFTVVNGDRMATLQWSGAERCGDDCVYDVHYWRAFTTDPSDYTTLWDVTSPYMASGLDIGGKYTFTVTARHINGSGPAAPWQTLFFGIMSPEMVIAQRPDAPGSIYNQGADVTLICEVLNFPHRLTYAWYHRGHPLRITDRVLFLNGVNSMSEGNYTCSASIADFTLKTTSFLNIRYNPKLSYHSVHTARPNVGAEAVLELWFQGHPQTNDLTMVWTKDDSPVRASSRVSLSAGTVLQNGLTFFKLKISDVLPSDYGSYRCRVTNQYWTTSALVTLMDPDTIPSPPPPSPEQKRNMTECCAARQVPELCMPICTMDLSIEVAVQDPDKHSYCLLFFEKLIQCAAGEGDHTMCCEKENVLGSCMPLCKGQIPPTADITDAPHLLKCVPEYSKILDCMETGFEKIPTAPVSIAAEVQDSVIKVTWAKPQRNAEDVTSYTVYYNYTGHNQFVAETITGAMSLSHEVKGVVSGRTYYIWMTADNQDVGRSQASAMLSVSIEETQAAESDKLSGGQIAGIVVGVVAAIAIIVVVIYLVRRQSAGQQKLMESVGYENSGYDNSGVKISSSYDKF